MLELNDTVESANLNDMIEFSIERQIRKKIVQSEIVVSELVCYEPGQFTKLHIHPRQDEIFFCVEGEGAITFTEQDDVPIKPGGVVFVPAGVRHGVATAENQRLVLMFTKGPGLPSPNMAPKKSE